MFRTISHIFTHLISFLFDNYQSGWSRGHLAAAGNHSCDQKTYLETFWLNSNIVPQEFSNNGGFWARFERFVKDLVKNDDFERFFFPFVSEKF